MRFLIERELYLMFKNLNIKKELYLLLSFF